MHHALPGLTEEGLTESNDGTGLITSKLPWPKLV